MNCSKLSSSDRRLLNVLLRGGGVDAEGNEFPLRSYEERLLRLIQEGYIQVLIEDKTFEELCDSSQKKDEV